MRRSFLENHGLRFEGADSHPRRFTLSCKPIQQKLEIMDLWSQHIICKQQGRSPMGKLPRTLEDSAEGVELVHFFMSRTKNPTPPEFDVRLSSGPSSPVPLNRPFQGGLMVGSTYNSKTISCPPLWSRLLKYKDHRPTDLLALPPMSTQHCRVILYTALTCHQTPPD